MTYNIIIGEDADLVILGAQVTLERDARFRIVGTARALHDLIAAAEMHQPHVIITHDASPEMDILILVAHLQRAAPQGKIIVMSGSADGLLIRDLFTVGVRGYLYKCDDLCLCLPLAAAAVMQGKLYLSPTANSEYLIALQDNDKHRFLDPELRAVLRLMTDGANTHEIARQLEVTLRRVYWLQQKLRNRFGAATNAQLILLAVEGGYLTAD
jgi:DNA-binding NarL/FixJ family response regulator